MCNEPAEISGFTVTSSAIIDHSTQLIMGEQYRDGFRLVYVVATAPHPDEAPTYWHQGHYFDGPDSKRNKEEARAYFAAELVGHWGVSEYVKRNTE